MRTRYDYFNQQDPNLRVSDADREAVADRLRRHHTDGRIDSEEFNERVDRCYAAKTGGELDALVADLPGERAPRDPGYGPSYRRGSVRGMIPFAPILIALIVASALTGWHALWLVFPLFFFSRTWLFRRSRWGLRCRHEYSDQQAV